MHVVSDADIIIHLSNLNKLSLLKTLYTEVAIPEYIKSEISGKHDESIQGAINSFLKVFPVSKDKTEKIAKQHDIHVGEANVKSLGEELNASILLSNERKVRQAAKLRIIEKAEANSLIEKMKSPEFRIHPDILQKALVAIKEL